MIWQCEYYENEKTCLECPYPDGQQKCFQSPHPKISFEPLPEMYQAIKALSELSDESISNTVRYLIRRGMELLTPDAREMVRTAIKTKTGNKKCHTKGRRKGSNNDQL